ncbi:M48 family metallopeptidase [Streptacidiphilus neutrinimicus]|uniref:M48 family metallopeptidase n=1 Tax=Streptacidiphilus neutrinimicus TaxID=105420 RepID=UPI001F1D9F96|nr:M56 family metallopeptidase [Streptacidiphilus neutrinimicus]
MTTGVTLTWWGTLIADWRPVGGIPQARCQVSSGYYLPMGFWLSPQDALKRQRYEGCLGHLLHVDGFWVLGVLLLQGLLALLLFAVQPWWHRCRARLVAVDALSSPEAAALRAELQKLVGLASLVRPPRFLLDPVDARPSGQAFGGLGRRQVALSAGLVVQRAHAPEKFRAVVAHELAHVRNGDVTVTYLTLAVWRAFVLVTVFPVLATLADPALQTTQPLRNPLRGGVSALVDQLTGLGWFFLVLIALAYATRLSVLRAREGYADARAAQWTDPAVLREVLLASAERDGTRWWHTHPRLLSRARLLERPARLLRPGFWETFAAAFAVQTAGDYLNQALGSWSVPEGSPAYQAAYDAGTLLTGLVVVVAAGRGAAFVRSGEGDRSVHTRAGLGLGLGLVSSYGLTILRQALLLRHQPALLGWLFDTGGLERDLVMVAFVLVAALALCHWAGHCWQLVATASRRNRLLAGGAMLLATWACLRWWNDLNYGLPPLGRTLSADAAVWRHFVTQAQGSTLDLVVVEAVLATFVLLWLLGPVTLFAVPLLWLVPLLLGAARRDALRVAARTGILAASVWLLIDLGLRAAAGRLSQSGEAPTDAGRAVVFLCWEIILVLVVQAGAALVLGIQRTRMMLALFATTLSGLLCSVLLWAAHRGTSCVPEPAQASGANSCRNAGDVFVAFEALRDIGVLGTALTVLGVLLGRRLCPWPWRGQVTFRPPGTATRLGLVAVAGVFVAVAMWPSSHLWPMPRHVLVDSLGAADYVPPPRYSREEIETESYVAWLQGGGEGQLETSFNALVDYFHQVAPMAKEQRPDWLAVARDPRTRAACQTVVIALGHAKAFPKPPWTKAASDWSAYLRQLARSADRCTAASTASDAQTALTDLLGALAAPQMQALEADQTTALRHVR